MNVMSILPILVLASVSLGADQAGRTTARDRVEQEVLEAEAALQIASVSSPDAAAAAQLVADDFVITHSNGSVQSRTEYLAGIQPARTRKPSQRDDIHVRVYGNTAVVTGRYVLVGLDGTVAPPRRFTNVWANVNTRWRQVSSHVTLVAPPAPAAPTPVAADRLRGIKAKTEIDALAASIRADARGAQLLFAVAGGRYRVFLNVIDSKPAPELHADKDEIFYVLSGSAQATLGGELTGARPLNATESRGTGVQGGVTQGVGPGDVLSVPRGTVHQLDPGAGFIVYLGITLFDPARP